uniref:F-box domain-containing protein n=1 Tax=Arundo donax TaxID=35708 RepID=A0A0A9FSJ5_ARUDO
MAPSSKAARSKKVAMEDGVDRLSTLPDGPLQHVLSFLPSRDAVRTSMLGRRWRDQWKSVRALRVMDTKKFKSANGLNMFINYLLLLRNRVPLDVVEIKCYGGDDLDESFRYIKQWVRYALSLEVQVLRVCIIDEDILFEEDNMMRWPLPNRLITSRLLKKLELIRVESVGRSLDFSSCPALKDLKMEFCDLQFDRITSLSLEHLSITYCAFKSNVRTRICTPSLISLELVDCKERTPLLERMPLLVSAFVRLRYCCDYCAKSYEVGDCGDNSCEGCRGSNIGNCTSVLLEGLSDAANLELTAETAVLIFRKDLTQCPVFSKLKTLLLNDWCLTANLGALICILQHSPKLEKLTLQLPEVSVSSWRGHNLATDAATLS